MKGFIENKKGDGGYLSVIARYPKGQDAAVKYYESDKHQKLKEIRAIHTDWNFRITEGTQ